MPLQRFLVLRGLPASGKSTWAKNNAGANTAIISKDDIRPTVLKGRKWQPKLEGEVIKIETELIVRALDSGLSVISDNTNLNPAHVSRYTQLAEKFNIQVEIVDFTDIPPEECIKRDIHRGEKAVGADVIWRNYWKWIAPKEKVYKTIPNLPLCVIFDIDGTLALFGDNNPYDRDFSQDKLNERVAWLYWMFEEREMTPIIFSGRKEKFHL